MHGDLENTITVFFYTIFFHSRTSYMPRVGFDIRQINSSASVKQ